MRCDALIETIATSPYSAPRLPVWERCGEARHSETGSLAFQQKREAAHLHPEASRVAKLGNQTDVRNSRLETETERAVHPAQQRFARLQARCIGARMRDMVGLQTLQAEGDSHAP